MAAAAAAAETCNLPLKETAIRKDMTRAYGSPAIRIPQTDASRSCPRKWRQGDDCGCAILSKGGTTNISRLITIYQPTNLPSQSNERIRVGHAERCQGISSGWDPLAAYCRTSPLVNSESNSETICEAIYGSMEKSKGKHEDGFGRV